MLATEKNIIRPLPITLIFDVADLLWNEIRQAWKYILSAEESDAYCTVGYEITNKYHMSQQSLQKQIRKRDCDSAKATQNIYQ